MLYHRVLRVWKWLCIVLNRCLFCIFWVTAWSKNAICRPFRERCAVACTSTHPHTHTWRKAFRNVINCIIVINFDYAFLQIKCMCPFLCCYYLDGCHWLLNSIYVSKYFDSESHWFYIETKTFFFLGSVYKHLRILTGKRDLQMKVQCLPKLCNKKFG